jgi:predicted secreted hydrolase
MRRHLLPLLIVVGLVATGCSGPILAQPIASRGPAPSSSPSPPPADDPQPIALPADDAPHHRLTEWWYYTGHLVDDAGARYGFEYVIFRAERGGLPVSWAAHLAITAEDRDAFHSAQRSEIGPQVDRNAVVAAAGGDPPPGFDLAIRAGAGGPSGPGAPPAATTGAGANPVPPSIASGTDPGSLWRMQGAGGHDRLSATATAEEAIGAGSPGGMGLDLSLAATKPATLHGGDGWIDFGPAGGSYYYSRTAMTAGGSLTLGGRTFRVDGRAWFDHQWGDFISVGGGGWDWFAIDLDDGTDLTLSLVRAADGTYPLVYGTIVDAEGHSRNLDASAFTVTPTGRWRSTRTGADYPSGWTVELPGEGLRIEVTPTVRDQELDTRATTGVVYWEGSQHVRATRGDATLGGEAYVELTGYGP